MDEGNSLKTQEKLCREYALKNGYEVAELFIEQGESAKNANRTELNRLMIYCSTKKNGINAVIAYKIDRIARNIDDYRFIRVQLKRYGIEIKSTSEYFEDTPAGRFMENIIANVAQFDNDVRTERSMGGMRDAMREGRYVWIAPFGYSNFGDPKAGIKSNIVPNEKASVIRKLFTEISKNEKSVDALRLELHSEGLATKKGWLLTKSHTYKLLNNEVYVGWIIKFGERHKGIYEPLISEELFQQVQRVLKRRAHRGFVYLRENPDFPLRRFVFHPSGKKITGYWAQGRHKKYAYYRFIGIPKTEIKKADLETAYMQLVDSYRLKSEHIEYLKQAMIDALGAATEKDFKEAERLRAYVAELYDRQTSLIEKNDKGILSDTVLKKQLDLIEEKLVKTHADLYKLPDEKEDIGDLMDFAKEYLENPAEVWQKSTFKTKLELQWFEFPQGVTFRDSKFRTGEIASIFKVKDIFSPLLSSRVPIRGQENEQDNSNKSPSISQKTLEKHAKDLRRLSEILKSKLL